MTMTLLAAGCSLGSETSSVGDGDVSSDQLEWTGSVGSKVPDGFQVVDAFEDSFGWPWAAVKTSSSGQPEALLVMNGNYSKSEGPEHGLWAMQSWIKLSADEYNQSPVEQIEIAGADGAALQDYSLLNEAGEMNYGTYVIMCDSSIGKCGMIRISFTGERDDSVREQILESIKYDSSKTEEQLTVAELQKQHKK